MPDIHGVASWPGVASVVACTYTCSHGITPGTAVLTCLPQDTPPDPFGDLVITDGNEAVTLPGCRLDDLRVEQGEGGTSWYLRIVDRRWRWGDLGGVDGCHNQNDFHGKLIPWTIQSPTELATRCLEAMGEAGYLIDLPPGLPAAVGQGFQEILPTGINFPPTGTNPPADWVKEPPARALHRLAEMYGRRVVYRVSTDSVAVVPLGEGGPLPGGSVHKQGPSLKSPEAPDAVGVVGAPTRYQMRLALEAVGEDWDGMLRPLAQLSYIPTSSVPDQAQGVAFAVAAGNLNLPGTNAYTITLTDPNAPAGAPALTATYNARPGDTPAVIAANLEAELTLNLNVGLALNPNYQPNVTITTANNEVVVNAVTPGRAFDFWGGFQNSNLLQGPNGVASTLLRAATSRTVGDWSGQTPAASGWAGVKATDRLTLHQARALAEKSVWKMYRVRDTDVVRPVQPDVFATDRPQIVPGPVKIQVPGYGELVRRQQLVLQDTQVEQIVPQPPDFRYLTGPGGIPLTLSFYNGYSKDKPAQIFGAVLRGYELDASGVYHVGAGQSRNTPATDQVFIPFQIDPVQQLVIFSAPAVRWTGSGLYAADLILQTAVLVRHPDGGDLDRFTRVLILAGQQGAEGLKVKWGRYDDVQLGVVGRYDGEPWQRHDQQTGATVLEADPVLRADYYLRGMAAQYHLAGAQTLEYNGVRAVDLDGAIQQVTWSVGEGGASTTASLNCEHHYAVPPYPARRRAEGLPPAGRGGWSGLRMLGELAGGYSAGFGPGAASGGYAAN